MLTPPRQSEISEKKWSTMEKVVFIYSHLSNRCDVTLTDFGKFHPTQNKNPPCTFIDFITKLSVKTFNILTESNEDLSHDYFKL